MYISNNISTDKVEKSALIAKIIIASIFLLLLFSFWSIQILKHEYYNELALGNITDSLDIKAPRGVIADKNGIVIAENKINFILLLNRKNTEDMEKTLRKISQVTGKSISLLKKKIKKFRNIPKIRAVPLLKDLSINEVIYIKSRPVQYKEFEIAVEPDRAYPLDKTASHVIGYISEISERELKNNPNRSYKLGDAIGKSGIEKEYETFLNGKKGIRDVLKNNLGVVKKIINEKKPEIGNKIFLTIDIELQKLVEESMAKNKLKGTIGVVDLKTGGIIALTSSPGFSPYSFWNIYSKKNQALVSVVLPAVLAMPNSPTKLRLLLEISATILITIEHLKDSYSLHNKFIQGRYSPGSVFKIIMALAGLEEKVITKDTKINCIGVTKIYKRPWHCWKEYGHGIVDLAGAIKDSCNIYFYNLGKKLNIDIIAKYAKLLGLGTRTNIDIPNEINGLIPTGSFKFKDNRRWFLGDTISISIGGGMIEVTPVQALLMISTVALRGNKPQLHILDRIEKNGKVIKKISPVFKKIPIKKENFELVINGLFSVVNEEGTAKLAMIKEYNICGKTGTQQIISKENPRYKELVKIKKFMPHAWFVSFAPKENPKYASVIFVENGGGAGTIAAPLAVDIYKKLFEK